MNKLPAFFLLLISASFISFSKAEPESVESSVLTPDETIIGSELIEFPNESRIYPNISDFKLLSSIKMSNLKGERWATITVRNEAHGKRTLTQDHILALFADGSRNFPLSFEQEFKSQQTISLLVNFGVNKFPILKITTRNRNN